MQIDKLTDREQLILDFLKDNNVDMAEVIDVIIKANGFVGGMQTLATFKHDTDFIYVIFKKIIN